MKDVVLFAENPKHAGRHPCRTDWLPPSVSQYCVVDYFGPFYMTVHRSIEKRWAFLLTCMNTRAVHIETGLSVDTGSCALKIEKFIARHSAPSVVWSDNGTNLDGAEKELLLCVQSWHRQAPVLLIQKENKWKKILLARRIMVDLEKD